MDDPHDNDAKLLAETFHDDWISGRPAAFARAAAAHARRRRRIRKTLSGAGIGAVLAVAGWLALRPGTPVLSPDRTAVPVAATRGYEIISDDELLSQLRDRPVLALTRANGTREIVVLANE